MRSVFDRHGRVRRSRQRVGQPASQRAGQRAGHWAVAKRRGVAATEFAIVVPVFVLLVFGILELGRALMVQQLLTNASRVGARTAILLSAAESDVDNDAIDYLNNMSVTVTGDDVTATPDLSTAQTGDQVTVTVSLDFEDVSWVPAPWFLGGASLSATSVMRKEGLE